MAADMQSLPAIAREAVAELTNWQTEGGAPIRIPIAVTVDGRVWYAFAALCAGLGFKREQIAEQRKRATDNPVFGECMGQLPMLTRGGRQFAWCIEDEALGLWLGTLNLGRVHQRVRAVILPFQRQLRHVARESLQHVFSGGQALAAPIGTSVVATVEQRVSAAEQFALDLERRVGRLEGLVGYDEE